MTIRTRLFVSVLLLIVGAQSFTGCKTKLPANALEEGRSCLLGVVPPSQVEQVRVWADAAQVGDYLMNPACDDAEMTRVLNDIRRDTR